MALTRKLLSTMGIEDDKIDEIIKAHRETVDALKEERDSFRDNAEALPDVQKKLDEAEKKISDMEADAGKDKWKTQYDALKKEYDEYKSGISAKEAKQRKSDAYRELLKEAGVSEKRIPSVLRVTDLDKVEVDGDGKIKDADKLKESIVSEWSDFIGKEQKEGANTVTPPKGIGGNDHTQSRAAMIASKHYEAIYGKAEDKT